MENIALFFHLLGAFSLVAGAVVASVGFEAARRRDSPAEIALLLGLTRVGVLLVGIGTLLVLVFGLWLVHLGHWGYGAGWVDGALGLLIAIGGQRPKQARKLATRLVAEHTPTTAELRSLLHDRTTQLINYSSAILLVVIVVLMVFKPGASHS